MRNAPRAFALVAAPLLVVGVTAVVMLNRSDAGAAPVSPDGPTVTILQPVQGSVLGLQSVQVLARAQDPDGVATAELRVNDKRVGSQITGGASTADMQFSWTPADPGDYTLRVRARDNDGKWGEAVITVSAGTGLPPLPPPPTTAPPTTPAPVTTPVTIPPPPTTTPTTIAPTRPADEPAHGADAAADATDDPDDSDHHATAHRPDDDHRAPHDDDDHHHHHHPGDRSDDHLARRHPGPVPSRAARPARSSLPLDVRPPTTGVRLVLQGLVLARVAAARDQLDRRPPAGATRRHRPLLRAVPAAARLHAGALVRVRLRQLRPRPRQPLGRLHHRLLSRHGGCAPHARNS